MNSAPFQRYIRKTEIRLRYGLTDSQIHRLIAEGKLPSPIYFGPRSPRWRLADLEVFEQRADAGQVANADQAAELTRAARTAYTEKAAAGEIAAKRRATAARRAESHKAAAGGPGHA